MTRDDSSLAPKSAPPARHQPETGNGVELQEALADSLETLVDICEFVLSKNIGDKLFNEIVRAECDKARATLEAASEPMKDGTE